MKKKGLIALFLACFGLLGFYTFDLAQVNQEELFFTRQGNARYKNLRDKLEEKKVILVEFKFPRAISRNDYSEIEKFLEGVIRGFREGQIEVYDFLHIYRGAIRDKSLEGQLSFASHHPSLLFRLLKRDSFSCLIFFQWDSDHANIRKALNALPHFRKDVKVSIAGLPYTNHLLNRYSENIKKRVFPLMFLICLVLTLYFTRNPLTTALIFFPCIFSLVVTLSAIKLFFVHMNIVTSIAPLLIFVINLSLCFHLYCASRERRDFIMGIRCKLPPIVLMIATTGIGFGSLMISEIPAIRQFAVISMGGIVGTSLLSTGWIYLVREHFVQGAMPTKLILGQAAFQRFVPRGAVILACVVIVTGALISFPRIQVITDATRYFPKAVQEAIDRIQQELIGNLNAEVLVERVDGKALEYPDLLNFERIEDRIGAAGERTSVLSANRLVAEANYLYSGIHKLPPFDIQYYTLYSRISQGIKKAYPHTERYRMTILGKTMNDRGFKKLLTRLNEIFAEYPQYKVEYSGIEYNMFLAQKSLIQTLAKSFLMTLLIITVIIFIYFRKGEVLLAFLTINIVPVMGSLIFIYLLGFSINVATVMCFSISLGIIVDSTIHITYDLLHDVPAQRHYQITLLPVIASSMILIAAFGSFGINDFLPIKQVGVILALTLFSGLLFDLFFLPALLKGRRAQIG